MTTLDTIEEVRKRAKEYSINNTRFYLSHSFESLSHIRNLLITISVSGFAVIYSQPEKINNIQMIAFILWFSLMFGIVSYILQWMALQAKATLSMEREKLWSTVFSNEDEYIQSFIQEKQLLFSDQPDSLYRKSLYTLVIQSAFLLISLAVLIL